MPPEELQTQDGALVNPGRAVQPPQEVDPNAPAETTPEVGVASSDEARKEAKRNQRRLSELENQRRAVQQVREAFSGETEGAAGEVARAFSEDDVNRARQEGEQQGRTQAEREITEATGEEVAPTAPARVQEPQIDDETQRQIDNLNTQLQQSEEELTEATNRIDEVARVSDEATQTLIANIKSRYKRRREETRDIFERQRQQFEQFGFRTGTARFAGPIQAGILSEVEQQKIDKLEELDSQEARLISEARQANTEQQFELLQEKISTIEETQKQKREQLAELQEEATKQQEEIAERNKKLAKQSLIINSADNGSKSPAEIFRDLNFDSEGNPVSARQRVSLEEISDTLDNASFDTGGELLSVSEAKSLGVPFGTTKEAAANMGIIPGAKQTVSTDEDVLAETIIQNPYLFNQLPPSKKTSLIPSLAQRGFDFPRDLSAAERTTQNNANSALTKLSDMENILFEEDGGVNRLAMANPVGDFAFARNEVLDIISRMRTGAAMTESEENFYQRQLPRMFNSEEVIREKINHWKSLFAGLSGATVILQDNEGNIFEAKDMFDQTTRADVRNEISNGARIIEVR